MATLGDPLADLGLFLLYWKRDEAQTAQRRRDDRRRRRLPARATRSSSATRRSRAATSVQLDFYEVLASYKLAIILEGIHARYLMGKTLGEGFDHIGTMVEAMVRARSTRRRSSSIPGAARLTPTA